MDKYGLIGSVKQINWAESIIDNKVADIDLSDLELPVNAGWWIDHRNDSPEQIIEAIANGGTRRKPDPNPICPSLRVVDLSNVPYHEVRNEGWKYTWIYRLTYKGITGNDCEDYVKINSTDSGVVSNGAEIISAKVYRIRDAIDSTCTDARDIGEGAIKDALREAINGK